MDRKRQLAFISGIIVVTLVYGIAIVGDFFLSRAINARLEAVGGEGRRLLHERYQTQDKALIAEAEEQGYRRRILVPLLVETTPQLKALGDTHGFAPLGLEADADLYICNEGHGSLKLTTDRFGFRNPDEIWNDPDVDMILVGDSFAFGSCQADNDTIAGNLSDGAVLNLSFPGALPIHYAAIVKTFGPAVTTKRLVLVFYANDREPMAQSSTGYHSWFFGAEADNSQFFLSKQPPQPSPIHRDFYRIAREVVSAEKTGNQPGPGGTFARNMARIGKLFSHASLPALRGQLNALRLSAQDQDEATDLAIDMLATHCAERRCAPLIVYIPNSQFWAPDPNSPTYPAAIEAIAGTHGVPFLDLTGSIAELGRAGYADRGIHLSAAGYTLVAAAIDAHFARH